MVKVDTLSKKGKKQQKMGVRDGLVAKKASQSKAVPVKKDVPMKAKNKGKGKNVAVQKNVGKNKNNKQAVSKKPAAKPKDEESEEEDDSEFESDEETVQDSPQKKGVKMFEGLQNSDDESDDDDDEDEDDDDDDDDEDAEGSSSGLKGVLGESMDDDDDDDDDEDEEDDDDEDEDEESEDEKAPGLSALLGDSLGDEEDDSDFNDEDDDDDEEEEDGSEEEDGKGPGLSALLGESLVDEEDDSDFNDEGQDDSDEDISDEEEDDEKEEKSTPPQKKQKKAKEEKPVKLSPEEQAKLDARTVYVGNVPKDTTPKAIKQFFRSCGEIENLRVRGVVAEDSRVSPKVATITKKLHPKVKTVYVYIAFKNEASAQKALAFNGKKFGDNILRVDMSNKKLKEHDQKKAVFLGNLPFEITEDEIHAHFAACGKIESVRVVKHRQTGLSRGIAYVNFEEEDSVALALELNDTKLKNRQIRVHNSSPGKPNKKRKQGDKQGAEHSGQKKFKTAKGEAKATDVAGKGDKKKRSQGEKKRGKSSDGESSSPAKSSSFQGQQAGEKKKSKKNKLDKKKKIMSEKLTSTKKSKA